MLKKDFSNLLISKKKSIKAAMKQLDETAEKNLFVINEKHQLIGALSDGDIRRAILEGSNLENEIDKVMNKQPKFVYDFDLDKEKKIKQCMLEHKIESLPILDNEKNIRDIVYWIDVFKENVKVNYSRKSNKVFILAGGVGSRLEPFTRILPKPLVPIGDQPIIEKIMDKFSSFGFDDFILSVNYKGEMIKLYLESMDVRDKYSDICYIKEDTPLGTIGSLFLAREHLRESFYITNSDILLEEDLEKIFNFHKNSASILTIVGCIKNSVIPYGVLKTDNNGLLVDIEEKPEYKHIINTGVYIAEPDIIDYILPNTKLDITELIEKLLKKGEKISIYPVFEGQWFDIGQWAEYENTRKHFEKL